MRRLAIAITVIALSSLPIFAGQSHHKSHASSSAITRGKYLVEDVGVCGDCHTPRNDKGEMIEAQRLKGATLDFKPLGPMLVWADKAPAIAGLPGWDKDAAIKFMMTGIAANGLPARPPMPQYRFNQDDAAAIVAYLESLGPAK